MNLLFQSLAKNLDAIPIPKLAVEDLNASDDIAAVQSEGGQNLRLGCLLFFRQNLGAGEKFFRRLQKFIDNWERAHPHPQIIRQLAGGGTREHVESQDYSLGGSGQADIRIGNRPDAFEEKIDSLPP